MKGRTLETSGNFLGFPMCRTVVICGFVLATAASCFRPNATPDDVPDASPCENLTFADRNLERAVTQSLMNENEPNSFVKMNFVKAVGAPNVEASNRQDLENLSGSGYQIANLNSIECLSKLTVVDLNFNEIKDIGPLTELENLMVLKIGDNPLSGINSVGNLKNLTELQLFSNSINDISETGDSELGDLVKLRTLYLDENSISDISVLAKLKELRTLWLDYNDISDISALENLTNLRQVKLYHNNVSDISPLVKNSENGTLKFVDIRRNALNCDDPETRNQIQTLIDNLVQVDHDCFPTAEKIILPVYRSP